MLGRQLDKLITSPKGFELDTLPERNTEFCGREAELEKMRELIVSEKIPILHGEAVAIGSILAAWLSVDMNLCSQELPEKISAQFEKWGLPTQFDATLKNSDLIAAMKKDKKTTGDHLNFVLLESIGNSVLAHDVPIKSVEYIFNEKGRKKSGFSFY